MSLRARQNGGGKIRQGGGRGNGNGSPGGRGNNGGGPPAVADTWDPTRKSASTTLSNGNLTAAAAGGSFGDWNMSVGIKSTTGLKAYFEIQINTIGGASRVGVAAGDQTVGGIDVNGYVAINPVDGLVYTSAGSTESGSGYANGDIIGVTVDWSLGQNNGEYKFYKNNVLNGRAYGQVLPVIGKITIGFFDASFTAHTFTMRTTAAEFSYAVPSGFTEWGAIANA